MRGQNPFRDVRAVCAQGSRNFSTLMLSRQSAIQVVGTPLEKTVQGRRIDPAAAYLVGAEIRGNLGSRVVTASSWKRSQTKTQALALCLASYRGDL